jgi:hypothetical protein
MITFYQDNFITLFIVVNANANSTTFIRTYIGVPVLWWYFMCKVVLARDVGLEIIVNATFMAFKTNFRITLCQLFIC